MFEEGFDVDAIGCQSGLSIMEGKQTTFMRVINVQTGDIRMATYEGTTPIDLSVYVFRLYSSEQIAYSVL